MVLGINEKLKIGVVYIENILLKVGCERGESWVVLDEVMGDGRIMMLRVRIC